MSENDNTFNYLAIKNWDKYQPRSHKQFPWIRDYIDREFDKDFAKLSAFQRYLLCGLCRLRGRLAHNIHNDVTYIAQALHMIGTDRPHTRHALDTLISHGFLVLCNERNCLLEEKRREEKREEESKKREPKQASPSAAKITTFILPGWIEKQTWEDYEQMRRRIGKPMTDRARNLCVDKLQKLQNEGFPVMGVLQQSIFNSWQGVFPIRGQNGSMREQGKTRLQEDLDGIEKAAARIFAEDDARDKGALPKSKAGRYDL